MINYFGVAQNADTHPILFARVRKGESVISWPRSLVVLGFIFLWWMIVLDFE